MTEMHCQSGPGKNKFSAFWDRMALSYPLPFEEKTFADTCRVLSLVKSKGVEFFNASILDIGCGTGIYTLPLACEAVKVTGIDDSETMLRRMTDVIESENIQNVHLVKGAWQDIDISACEFEKAFDIVWISMSPAIQTSQDFNRMEKCARKWCVYIGWGRKRKNALMEEAFRYHNIPYGPPPGVGVAYDILVHSGKAPSLEYFETSWRWKGPAEHALEDIVCFIEMQGATARRDLVKKTIDRHERDGMICHTTYVEEGILVWPVE